jgi:hypothetical protein
MKAKNVCYHGAFNEEGEYCPYISEVDGIYRCSICHKMDESGKYELLEEFFLGKAANAPEQFFSDIDIAKDIIKK